MPNVMELQSQVADIAAIVEDVFATMLDMRVEPTERRGEPRSYELTAAVQFTGENAGSLLLQCNREQAQFFAGRMIPDEAGPFENEMVHDVLGEVANIVGGNVKSLLSPGGAMSTPIVVAGSDFTAHVWHSGASQILEFSSEAGSFRLTLVKTTVQ